MPRGLTREERTKQVGGSKTIATVLFRVGRWARNIVANENKIRNSKGVNFLFNKLRDRPSILVSAGPSLDKNVGLLKEVYDKACIIACDASIGSIIDSGVKPHICFVTDCKPIIHDYIETAYQHSEDIILVCDSFVHPSVYEDWKGPVFFYNIIPVEECALTNVLYEFTGSIGCISSGGGVSTTMLCMAHAAMKSNKIIFLGHDFSFTELKKTHSANPSKIDDPNEVYQPFQVEDNVDNKVWTNKAYLGFCHWTEDWMLSYKEPPALFINATEGGILTNGCVLMKFRDVIDNFLTESFDVISTLLSEENLVESAKPENRWLVSVNEEKREIRQDSTYFPGELVDAILDNVTIDDLQQAISRRNNVKASLVLDAPRIPTDGTN